MKTLIYNLLGRFKSLFKQKQQVRTYTNPIEVETSINWEVHCLFDLNPTLIKLVQQQPNDQELGACIRKRYNIYQKDSYLPKEESDVVTLK